MARFEIDNQRFYETSIGNLPSATTIIKQFSKGGALVGWSAKLTASKYTELVKPFFDKQLIPSKTQFYEIENLAKNEHREVSKESMANGTILHSTIETHHRGQPVHLDNLSTDVQADFKAYQGWEDKYQFKVIKPEQSIWSKRRYAGTLDAVGEFQGEKRIILLDYKRSKDFYEPDYVMQIAAYYFGYMEMTGEKVDGAGVLRLYEGKPFWREYTQEQLELGFVMFMGLCQLWWTHKAYKELKGVI
jgi:hypothetical protein